jgi:hypothetical protein
VQPRAAWGSAPAAAPRCHRSMEMEKHYLASPQGTAASHTYTPAAPLVHAAHNRSAPHAEASVQWELRSALWGQIQRTQSLIAQLSTGWCARRRWAFATGGACRALSEHLKHQSSAFVSFPVLQPFWYCSRARLPRPLAIYGAFSISIGVGGWRGNWHSGTQAPVALTGRYRCESADADAGAGAACRSGLPPASPHPTTAMS